MSLTLGDEVSSTDVIASIESFLAEELGVHPQNVAVEYDSETGVVTYTITSDSAETLVALQADLDADFAESLDSNLGDNVSVENFVAPENVVVTIDYAVDASQVDDVDAAVANVEASLEENNFTYESTGKQVNTVFKGFCEFCT